MWTILQFSFLFTKILKRWQIWSWLWWGFHKSTPPKTNMTMGKQPVEDVHPWKSTCNLKITQFKGKSSSRPPFFGVPCSFYQGASSISKKLGDVPLWVIRLFWVFFPPPEGPRGQQSRHGITGWLFNEKKHTMIRCQLTHGSWELIQNRPSPETNSQFAPENRPFAPKRKLVFLSRPFSGGF